ncbi:MAG: SGNH/GDSL hydrolase family protein [Planctomycetota bacterium]
MQPNDAFHGDTEASHDPAVPQQLRVRRGLPHVLAKVRQAGDDAAPLKVAYLGGSITRADGWRTGTFAWLQERFPEAELVQINAAVPGTGADFAAARLHDDLLRHEPDLVFVEFRVNGGGPDAPRAIEGVVRQIREANPTTDICFVYTIGEWMLKDFEAGRQFWFGRAMEAVADRYGIPSVDLGVEVFEQMQEGRLLFKADTPVEGKLVFSRDGVHPGQAGHELYTQVVTRSLETVFDADRPAEPHGLPEPIHANHYARASLMPASAYETSSGWEAVDTQHDDVYTRDRMRSRAMLGDALRTDQVGASLTVTWEGTRLVLTHIPQGDGITIEVAQDGGVPETLVFKQGSPERLHAQFIYLPELPQGRHTTTVMVKALPEGAFYYAGQSVVARDP